MGPSPAEPYRPHVWEWIYSRLWDLAQQRLQVIMRAGKPHTARALGQSLGDWFEHIGDEFERGSWPADVRLTTTMPELRASGRLDPRGITATLDVAAVIAEALGATNPNGGALPEWVPVDTIRIRNLRTHNDGRIDLSQFVNAPDDISSITKDQD